MNWILLSPHPCPLTLTPPKIWNMHLMTKVSTNALVKFIHVFNGSNHLGYIEVIVPFKKVSRS